MDNENLLKPFDHVSSADGMCQSVTQKNWGNLEEIFQMAQFAEINVIFPDSVRKLFDQNVAVVTWKSCHKWKKKNMTGVEGSLE